MKTKLLLFVFLILFIPVQAMSGSVDIQPEIEEYKITQEELHNLAVNYYKFMYGEEHEWKGINRKEGEDIIKDITPLKDGELTVAYMVNYNPDGHVQIIAHKNSYPFDRHGGGYYYFNVDSTIIKEIDIEDKWFHPIERSGLRMIRDRVINKVAPIAKEQVLLDKFL
ncbi:MAG: hypothetical protein GQ534_06710, partial [Candidatus Delongbacteria bacterium]|nr:hypothetical protein [Candidatus Delongbacteria bacterium]